MNKRVNLLAVLTVCILLAAAALGVVACGSDAETTTTAPTAAPTTTTSAGSTTLPSLQLTPELQTYLGQIQALFASIDALPADSDPFSITDVSTVTDEQIAAIENATGQIRTALDGLNDLQPPVQLSPFHEVLVTMIAGTADIADKAVEALKDKDQAKFDAAKAEAEALEAQMAETIQSLMSSLTGGGTTPTS